MKVSILLSSLLFVSLVQEGEAFYSLRVREQPKPAPEAAIFEEPKNLEKPKTNWGMISTHVDYLYWQAMQEGLEYVAVTNDVYENNSGTNLTASSKKRNLGLNPPKNYYIVSEKQTFKDIHPEYRSGFRIGIGYQFAQEKDAWDINLDWTSYQGHAKGHVGIDTTLYTSEDETMITEASLAPLWGPQSIPNDTFSASLFSAVEASSHWNLNYQTLDLHLGKYYPISPKVSFHPYFGIQSALIQQQYSASYFFPETTSNSGNPGSYDTVQAFSSTFKGHNDFHGIGLQFGAETDWKFSPYFGICGEISGALLWGRFHVKETVATPQILTYNPSDDPPLSVTSPAFTIKEKEHLSRLCPNLQGSAGIYWQTTFAQKKHSLKISLDYEFIAWFFQNHFWNPSFEKDYAGSHNGDELSSLQSGVDRITNNYLTPTLVQSPKREGCLSLQGLTASIRYDF